MKLYMTTYNFLQLLGWSVLLVRIMTQGPKDIYKDHSISFHLKLLQMSMFLEVFHSIFKISPSPLVPTLLQLTGRVINIFGAMDVVPGCYWIFMVMIAWSCSEVIRYGYYFVNDTFGMNRWIYWARYTMFIPLYPLGFVSEIMVYYDAYEIFKKCCPRINSFTMPNSWNFSFDFLYFFWIVVVPAFTFGAPYLYLYMFQQRKKKLKVE